MNQLIYASLSQTHYWHEVGMLYLFTMIAPARTLYFYLFFHHYTCIRVRAMCEYQQNTCTAVNMYSGRMDALTPDSGKI